MYSVALSIPSNADALAPGDRAVTEPQPTGASVDALPLVASLGPRPLVATLVVVAWVATGVVTALVMARRGHEFRTLAPLGVLVGPFLVGLARSNYIQREAEIEPLELSAGVPGEGRRSVLVAVLGDPEDVVDVVPVLRSLEGDLGEVTLARSVPFESAGDPAWDDVKDGALALLEEAARLLPGLDPRLVLLPGRAESAMVRHAVDRGVDFVVGVGLPKVRARLRRNAELRRHGIAVFEPGDSGGDVHGRRR